jgi:ATP/maltotriose-dependent transcriptional regulator MalT
VSGCFRSSSGQRRTTKDARNSSIPRVSGASVVLTGRETGQRAHAAEPQPVWLRLAAGRQHLAAPRTADPPHWASVEARRARLTRREWEVLSVLVTGVSNGEIAARLHISPSTVANHLANIFDKMETKNRTQAVARALGMGPGPFEPIGNLPAEKPDIH